MPLSSAVMRMLRRDLTGPAGLARKIHKQSDGGALVVESAQFCGPLLELNKRQQRERVHPNGAIMDGTWHHVARIPNVIIERWANEYGFNPTDPEAHVIIDRLLDMPEWQYLRVNDPSVKVSDRVHREHPTTIGQGVHREPGG